MIISNNYYYFTKALDNNICDKILELGKEKLKTSGIMAGTLIKEVLMKKTQILNFKVIKLNKKLATMLWLEIVKYVGWVIMIMKSGYMNYCNLIYTQQIKSQVGNFIGTGVNQFNLQNMD